MKRILKASRLEKYEPLSDAENIKLYQQGEEPAGEALYNKYQVGMLHYATVFVGPYLGQDVMQDTWEAVLRGLGKDGSYREEQLFNKYIKSIVLRQALVTLKEERRFGMTDAEPEEGPDEDMYAEEEMIIKQSAVLENPGEFLNPEEQLIKTQTDGILMRALRKAGQRATRIVILRVVHGMSFKEICVMMGISAENVARSLYSKTLREICLLLAPFRGAL